MIRNSLKSALLIALLGGASMVSSEPTGPHAVFTSLDGSKIELNTEARVLRIPGSHDASLYDCSDKFQICLTDRNGFAFSYFRKCSETNYDLLKFRPKFVTILHNDMWLVFDASPNYMFHYVLFKGIVGIYVGRTPSYDFRGILHDWDFKITSLDAVEYRIVGTNAVAACGG
ncbi:hypothetical protein [Dyella nitratireducens]|uniref:hypothetical protein n=1 Tax=Dyella nitratireducens TaxID=1849580 RepID=UPI001663B177|nr:hypothetical protein [Dyella nitratireducens]